MRTRRRTAFTMFDLLVVLAIFAFLLALLLPAVQKVRQAAACTQSQNNLRQLGLACHDYHDSNDHLPPGNDSNNFSAAAWLLPFLEQDNVRKQIKFDKPMDDNANAEARKAVIKVFLDPQDPVQTVKEGWGATNYVFNAGSKPGLEDNDGVFFQASKIKLTQITDGCSQTLMIGQTLKGDGQTKAVTVERQCVALNDKGALKKLKDDSGVKEWKAGKHIAGDRCASWMDGRFLQGTFNSARKLNDPRPDVSAEGDTGGLSALRTLGAGVNVIFCDGHSEYIKTTIDPKIWKALSTANGGEVIPAY